MLTPTGSSFSAPATTREDYARMMTNVALSEFERQLLIIRELRMGSNLVPFDARFLRIAVKRCEQRLTRAEAFAAELPR